ANLGDGWLASLTLDPEHCLPRLIVVEVLGDPHLPLAAIARGHHDRSLTSSPSLLPHVDQYCRFCAKEQIGRLTLRSSLEDSAKTQGVPYPCSIMAIASDEKFSQVLEEGRARRSLPPPTVRRHLREAAGVSQSKLAGTLGVQPSTLS